MKSSTVFSPLTAGVAAGALLFGAAQAATFNFTGSLSNLGKSETYTDGSDSLTATAINTEEPNSADLVRTNSGIGVYTGGLDSAQVDNVGDDEAIVFDFGSAAFWDSIGITNASFFDDIYIYGSNNAAVTAITSGGLASIIAISTLLVTTTGTGLEGSVTIDLSGIASAYRYLIATIPGGSGDGYRVEWLTASEVPLPAALPLMLSGVLGLGFAARLRRRLRTK